MRLTITIVTDRRSWMNDYIPSLIERLDPDRHAIRLIDDVRDIGPGDLAFFLSCEQIVPKRTLILNAHNLVVHASDLPNGKGWSPLTWRIAGGENTIPIVLFEAEEKVDSGDIYLRDTIQYNGRELIGELRARLAEKTVDMCAEFVARYPHIVGEAVRQSGESSYYRRRTPEDSRLDPHKSIVEQFNLLRVADNDRYPCYFELGGETFVLKIEKGS